MAIVCQCTSISVAGSIAMCLIFPSQEGHIYNTLTYKSFYFFTDLCRVSQNLKRQPEELLLC